MNWCMYFYWLFCRVFIVTIIIQFSLFCISLISLIFRILKKTGLIDHLFFQEFIYTAKSRESVHTVCRMADSMLRRTPLYRFINRGDAESSAMLYDLIKRVEKLWD